MRELMFNQAINEGLRLCMQEDETIVLLGEDIGPYGGLFQVTAGLLEQFGPERVRDTPISEAGFVGAAVGAAMTGLRPVAEVGFIDLTTVCMDMIVNQMAKMRWMFGGQCRVPMVLRTSSGPGRNAAAQHSQNFYSFFMHIPGLYVAAPSTPYDAKGLIIESIKAVGVFEAAKEAVSRARSGQGPSLIECKTYRYRGHHEGDPNMGARYRTREEIEAWKKRDPIDRMTKRLLRRKGVTRSQLSGMKRDVMALVKGAVEFGLESPSPEPQELYEDVYV